MPLSCVCSPAVRQLELSPLFVNLLRDQSRWVRMAAFQALGPFISTFADSSITELLHNDNGEIVVKDHESLSARWVHFKGVESLLAVMSQQTFLTSLLFISLAHFITGWATTS